MIVNPMLVTPIVHLLLAALGPFVSYDGDPFRSLDLEAALAAAKKEEKVVMIDFFTTWCEPCKKLDATTWKDPKVVAWLEEHTVAIKLDAEKEDEVAARYGVRAYPTMTFVKPDGTRMDQIVGYRTADDFLSEAADALAGRTAVDRARAALVGNESDPMLRYDLGQELARAGLHAEALVELLWCWDHALEHDQAFYGVRLSFLLSSIADLAREHPPAKEAMLERCDAIAVLVRGGGADERQIKDMIELDEKFAGGARTLALFDELAGNAERAAACRTLAEAIAPQLVEEQRYVELLSHTRNAAEVLREGRRTIERLEAEGKGEELGDEYLESAIKTLRSRTVGEAGRYFEALAAVGERPGLDQPSVDSFQEQILALSADGWTYYRLIQHATRAGDASRARALVERARAGLTDERDLKRIERAAKKLPKAQPADAPAGG